MPIKKSFGGKNIYKPGSYSTASVDASGGGDLAANDTAFIIGESTKGKPGSSDGIQSYSSAQFSQLVAKYGAGPIVDMAKAVFQGSKTQGIVGAGRVLVYKTNASTQASKAIINSSGTLMTAKDRSWGAEGNDLQVIVAAGSGAQQRTLSVAKLGARTENLGENAGQSALTIEYTGDSSTFALSIAGASRSALALTSTLAGDETDGSAALNISLAGKTMKSLVDEINAQTGYTASLSYVPWSQKSALELDPVSASTAETTLYRSQYELLDLLNTSARVEAEISTTVVEGLPDAGTYSLTGGAQGASSNSAFATGFTKSLAKDYNVALPAISRDASEDIADAVQGFTDAASDYDLDSVIAALDSHLRLRGDVKNRREAQGMVGVRKSTKAAAFASVSGIGSELIQACIQDVYVNTDAGLEWKGPHVMAGLLAGIRLGSAVGEPMTHKLINARSVGHFVNAETGTPAGDFDPIIDGDEAIMNCVTSVEPVQGGFRVVVDNTTYGIDDSFIYNRGSVIEAAQYVYRTIRETTEKIFVGKKLSNGAATSIKEAVRNKLRELNADDVQIITSSDDAPEGFVEETFVVAITGNTARVSVEIKPVQGLDFILIEFTVSDVTQSA